MIVLVIIAAAIYLFIGSFFAYFASEWHPKSYADILYGWFLWPLLLIEGIFRAVFGRW